MLTQQIGQPTQADPGRRCIPDGPRAEPWGPGVRAYRAALKTHCAKSAVTDYRGPSFGATQATNEYLGQ
jgi:hypothetical protein